MGLWPLSDNNRSIFIKHWIVVLSMTILRIIRCEIGLVYYLKQQPRTHHPILPIWGNPVRWTPTLEPLWCWNGDDIFICVNPQRQWMWNRRCQSTKWFVSFCVLGVFCLFAGLLYLIFVVLLSCIAELVLVMEWVCS
jgi:hypothetical protein